MMLIFGSGTDPISLLSLFVLFVGATLQKNLRLVLARIGMKLGRNVLQLNTHR